MIKRIWLWLWPEPEEPKKLPHKWTPWTITDSKAMPQGFVALFAMIPGVQSRRCTECGLTETAPIQPIGVGCTSSEERAQ